MQVGGSDSVYSPGYLSSLQREYGHWPNITFHGYVPEVHVPSLFQQSAAAVLPYRTTTGASSVAMQAAMYGTAILAADVPGLHLMGSLGLEMTFLKFEDPSSLAAQLAGFLSAPLSHAGQVEHNLAYCRTVRMVDIVNAYLDEIESLDHERHQGRMTVEMRSSVATMRDSET
ncbi:MAG: glycosyltransferase [Acidobacteria bacterium]|nr:glycosyltransferase [Acidobacteriota bacterium]MCA1652086.1 glycosyltransferase [Acidobacteriota bacterium]